MTLQVHNLLFQSLQVSFQALRVLDFSFLCNQNLLIFQKTRGKIFTTIGSGVCRGVWEGVPMKHLLRAMGAAMLAALLLSACSTPQEQTEPSAPQTTQATQAATGATEESATEAEELLALPRDLGSGLTLQAVLPFSGPNVDADGAESDQLATIIVQNDGGMAVGAADITLTCEDGAELRFRVTDLPVGGSCYAFELNSAQYTGENRVCAASAEVEPDGSLSVDYRVSVMVQDGGLVLVNMTEDTLHNVTVRYRTDTGGTYFGGLSYTATVEELAPGASQTVLAAECYMGLPSVIAVSADES